MLTIFLQSLLVFAQNTETYVNENKQQAIALMNEHHIPASIILGVAIHESASGNSKIAKYLNNHFGIKGVNHQTLIKSSYKGYDAVEDSYTDFIRIMKSKNQFNKLFDVLTDYDYKAWAKGIQRGGYAASKTWSAQVVAIINKYKLFDLDNKKITKIEEPEIIRPPFEEVIKTFENNIYVVKKGDTLNSIAKKFNTNAKAIIQKNNLKSIVINVGQKINL